MGCSFQEYKEWEVKGERGRDALAAGRAMGGEDAAHGRMQPCSPAAFLWLLLGV